eukprot:superscaffoldBa00008903_g23717
MFLRQLSSFGSSFLRRGRAAPCRAGFRSGGDSSASPSRPHFTPAPPPWWTVRGFPPWPPRLPRSHPAARQLSSGRTLHLENINPGAAAAAGSWRSFNTSAGLMMERSDRGPPHKRRKSVEEKGGNEERERNRGGAPGGKAKDGGSKREQHHLDPGADGNFRPNHRFKDGKHGAGKGGSRENSRDKDSERTKSGNKDRDGNTQRRDGAGRDETQHRGRSAHQQGGRKDSQPAASRTQTSGSKPEQQTQVTHKPNPWFKDRDRSRDGGGRQSQPRSTAPPPNPWQVAGADRQPPPPGTCPQVPVKALQRQWESSPACRTFPQPPGVNAAFDFSVLSYNILSQELLRDNIYLYQHCHPGVLPWEYRLPNLLNEIRQYDADILCYQCEYKKRTGKKPDGCAVIFKTSRLSLLSSNPVEFFRPGDALLDRDNVGLVVLLRPNAAAARSDPSAFICVANTHLLYNPRRGDIKLAQLAILLAEIKRLSRLPDGSSNPVVLCGDFNSTPLSPLYSFLTTGSLEARIEHSLKLQSSYQHCLPPDGRPEITTCHSRTAMTVDYILYTPAESIASPSPPGGRGLQLLGRLSLVGQSELEDVNGLPNHQHSSDHLPLLARFRYQR